MFNKIFAALAAKGGKPDGLIIGATHLKAHRRQPLKKRVVPRRIGRTKDDLNSKLHAICDRHGTTLSEGQMSDYRGAALMIDALPKGKELIGDKGYDGDWFRQALAARGTSPCIPSKSNRKVKIPHDPMLYRERHKVEIMFGRLKDWRRITPATTDARAPSSRPSPSPRPSSSGCRNES